MHDPSYAFKVANWVVTLHRSATSVKKNTFCITTYAFKTKPLQSHRSDDGVIVLRSMYRIAKFTKKTKPNSLLTHTDVLQTRLGPEKVVTRRNSFIKKLHEMASVDSKL
ncbi:hypothetical protein V7S43_007261 [Phytophthora oleae]|uniref:Uncharacterized protein n=1 Tax=Phytophthora oleae TaxID=2107226 RepID=A0ABD3FLU0_9STRA